MPNQLHELTVDEVSLVDHPSCAETDPLTGRKVARATVAIWKRDNSQGHEGPNQQSVKETTKMSKFKQILKSATSREQITAAVVQKAEKIAKKQGISLEKAEAKAWGK